MRSPTPICSPAAVTTAVGCLARDDADLVGETVDLRDLLAGVGDHQLTARCLCGEDATVRSTSLAWITMTTSAHQFVEHLTRSLTTAHPQR